MRTSLMTGGLLALAALLPPAGRAQTGGPTPVRGHAPDGGTPRHGH